jgi:hypothetical protein
MLAGCAALFPAAGDQRGQRVIPLTEPVPLHRRGGQGRTIRTPGAQGELAGCPETQRSLLPFVKVLQREGTGVKGCRMQVVVAGIVAHE